MSHFTLDSIYPQETYSIDDRGFAWYFSYIVEVSVWWLFAQTDQKSSGPLLRYSVFFESPNSKISTFSVIFATSISWQGYIQLAWNFHLKYINEVANSKRKMSSNEWTPDEH